MQAAQHPLHLQISFAPAVHGPSDIFPSDLPTGEGRITVTWTSSCILTTIRLAAAQSSKVRRSCTCLLHVLQLRGRIVRMSCALAPRIFRHKRTVPKGCSQTVSAVPSGALRSAAAMAQVQARHQLLYSCFDFGTSMRLCALLHPLHSREPTSAMSSFGCRWSSHSCLPAWLLLAARRLTTLAAETASPSQARNIMKCVLADVTATLYQMLGRASAVVVCGGNSLHCCPHKTARCPANLTDA